MGLAGERDLSEHQDTTNLDLHADIAALKTNHKNLDEKIDTLADSIQSLARRMDNQHSDWSARMRTPWANIISGVSVAVVIVAGLAHSWIAPVQKDLLKHEEVIALKMAHIQGEVAELKEQLSEEYGELHADLLQLSQKLEDTCRCKGD